MADAVTGDRDVYDGEVGGMVVTVVALVSGPAEDVEGEVGVRGGPEGGVDVGGGEAWG